MKKRQRRDINGQIETSACLDRSLQCSEENYNIFEGFIKLRKTNQGLFRCFRKGNHPKFIPLIQYIIVQKAQPTWRCTHQQLYPGRTCRTDICHSGQPWRSSYMPSAASHWSCRKKNRFVYCWMKFCAYLHNDCDFLPTYRLCWQWRGNLPAV